MLAGIDDRVFFAVGAVAAHADPAALPDRRGRRGRRQVEAVAVHQLAGPHGIALASPLTASGRADMVDADVAGWLPASVAFLHSVLDTSPDQEN